VSDTYTDITVRPPGSSSPAANGGWDSFPEAKAASWDAFPEAKPSKGVKDTAVDVAKSAGIGLVRGAIGVAGMAGDLTDLGSKGIQAASDYVSDKIGVEPYKRPAGGSVLDRIPGSQDITSAVEGVTGDFYKPETTAGEYARTIGEFVPAALAGPGGLVRKGLLQAVIPGVASEAAGQATQGSPAEPYARAGAGIAAGLGGMVMARPSSTTSAIRAQLPEGVTQAAIDDARSLMVTAKAKGVDLTWPEALSQVSGRPVLSDTQRILESAPGSRTRMQEFYSERPAQMDQAALNEFGQVAAGTRSPSQIGPQAGAAANEALGDVRKAINSASEPYYKAAEAQVFSPQEFAALKTIPGYKESIEAVRKAPDAWRISICRTIASAFLIRSSSISTSWPRTLGPNSIRARASRSAQATKCRHRLRSSPALPSRQTTRSHSLFSNGRERRT
jgi:hypothetical protein